MNLQVADVVNNALGAVACFIGVGRKVVFQNIGSYMETFGGNTASQEVQRNVVPRWLAVTAGCRREPRQVEDLFQGPGR